MLPSSLSMAIRHPRGRLCACWRRDNAVLGLHGEVCLAVWRRIRVLLGPWLSRPNHIPQRCHDGSQLPFDLGVLRLSGLLRLNGGLELLVLVRVLEVVYDGLEVRDPVLGLFPDCALGNSVWNRAGLDMETFILGVSGNGEVPAKASEGATLLVTSRERYRDSKSLKEISGVLTILPLPIALLLRHARNRPRLLRPSPGLVLAVALTWRLELSRRHGRCRPGAPVREFILDLGRRRVWRLGEGVGKALR